MLVFSSAMPWGPANVDEEFCFFGDDEVAVDLAVADV